MSLYYDPFNIQEEEDFFESEQYESRQQIQKIIDQLAVAVQEEDDGEGEEDTSSSNHHISHHQHHHQHQHRPLLLTPPPPNKIHISIRMELSLLKSLVQALLTPYSTATSNSNKKRRGRGRGREIHLSISHWGMDGDEGIQALLPLWTTKTKKKSNTTTTTSSSSSSKNAHECNDGDGSTEDQDATTPPLEVAVVASFITSLSLTSCGITALGLEQLLQAVRNHGTGAGCRPLLQTLNVSRNNFLMRPRQQVVMVTVVAATAAAAAAVSTTSSSTTASTTSAAAHQSPRERLQHIFEHILPHCTSLQNLNLSATGLDETLLEGLLRGCCCRYCRGDDTSGNRIRTRPFQSLDISQNVDSLEGVLKCLLRPSSCGVEKGEDLIISTTTTTTIASLASTLPVQSLILAHGTNSSTCLDYDYHYHHRSAPPPPLVEEWRSDDPLGLLDLLQQLVPHIAKNPYLQQLSRLSMLPLDRQGVTMETQHFHAACQAQLNVLDHYWLRRNQWKHRFISQLVLRMDEEDDDDHENSSSSNIAFTRNKSHLGKAKTGARRTRPLPISTLALVLQQMLPLQDTRSTSSTSSTTSAATIITATSMREEPTVTEVLRGSSATDSFLTRMSHTPCPPLKPHHPSATVSCEYAPSLAFYLLQESCLHWAR